MATVVLEHKLYYRENLILKCIYICLDGKKWMFAVVENHKQICILLFKVQFSSKTPAVGTTVHWKKASVMSKRRCGKICKNF